jgi:hypothetical protein
MRVRTVLLVILFCLLAGIAIGTKWSDYGDWTAGNILDVDTFLVRDVSDTSLAATGTQKEYPWSEMKTDIGTATITLTNKTLDANGTGNVLSNIDEDNMLDGSDAVTDYICFLIDGGGSAITTGIKGYAEIPYNATIKQVTMLADQTGSIVVDIWKDTYAQYPPVDGDSITASAVPEISSGVKDQDNTLTGWTTAITAGDILAWNVDSASTIEFCTICLKIEK